MRWKTYEEVNLNDYFAGADLLIYKCLELEKSTIILAKSRNRTCRCPKCGCESSSFHSTYGRTIQVLPINMKPTYIQPILYEFDCLNSECSVKTFTEQISCAEKWSRRSQMLNLVIFTVSIFLSSESASRVLKLMGIRVSGDTIARIYDSIVIPNDSAITEVGIDDVAIRKGQSYATAVYDAKDHHLVALLDGRTVSSLSGWLKEHPKIKLVARDRASAYASALSEIIPDCVQIADRFHLLQNLLEHMKRVFNEEIPRTFFVQNGHLLDYAPEKTLEIAMPLTSDEVAESGLDKYDCSPPVDENGNGVLIDDACLNPYDKVPMRRTANRLKKQKLIQELQEEAAANPDITQKKLAEKYKISLPTAAKYLKMTDEEIKNVAMRIRETPKTGGSILRNYANVIYKMQADHIPPPLIVRYVKYIGCPRTVEAIETYVRSVIGNNFHLCIPRTDMYQKKYPPSFSTISSGSVLKYITAKEKLKIEKSDTARYYELIENEYPAIRKMKMIWDDFHTLIMGDNPSEVGRFISDNSDSEFSEIRSFAAGLIKDKAAVENAIKYDTNSGFVEGNNCKFKLIKRTIYGRSSLDYLFRKSYAAFKATTDSFEINELFSHN
ncbi:MAG: ISL3 family transposase [Lachnospiraceae bacterium]|nr:ISL3 family transposase [Lachnospiraceae bacterium]